MAAATATGDPRLVSRAESGVARALVQAGRRSEAMSALLAVIDDARSRGYKDIEAESQLWLARAQLGPRGGSAAETAARDALRSAEEIEARALVAQSHWVLAESLEAGGRSEEAARHRVAAADALAAMRAEAGDEPITRRADLAPIAGG